MRSIILVLTFIMFSSTVVAQDYSAWNELLNKYVSAEGEVNYSGFKSEELKLDQFLGELSAMAPSSSSKEENLAYWSNAYNAFTIKLILNSLPLKSIMEVDNGKAWDRKFIKIGNETYSLNQIEHEIIRKKFFDPRIHFILNCAALSCPRLHNQAFTPNNIESVMQALSVEFINNSRKNELSTNPIKVSQLFNWYKEDFTKDGSTIDFINKYSKEKLSSSVKVSYMEYDWSLNGTTKQ